MQSSTKSHVHVSIVQYRYKLLLHRFFSNAICGFYYCTNGIVFLGKAKICFQVEIVYNCSLYDNSALLCSLLLPLNSYEAHFIRAVHAKVLHILLDFSPVTYDQHWLGTIHLAWHLCQSERKIWVGHAQRKRFLFHNEPHNPCQSMQGLFSGNLGCSAHLTVVLYNMNVSWWYLLHVVE